MTTTTLTSTVITDQLTPKVDHSVIRVTASLVVAHGTIPASIVIYTVPDGYVFLLDSVMPGSTDVATNPYYFGDGGVSAAYPRVLLMVPAINQFSPATPFPGTPFYKNIMIGIDFMEASKESYYLVTGRLVWKHPI